VSAPNPMTDKELTAFASIPKPPDGSAFRFPRVTTITEPHLYCIGSRHVNYAHDKYGGMLSADAIRDAERYSKAHCEMRGCRLPYDDHKSQLVVVVVVQNDAQKSLNDVPGLHAWLLSVKGVATANGIEGFMFPTEEQERRSYAS
jgi:hypothetical protein